jgi:voltage-gated potassium channel Kch
MPQTAAPTGGRRARMLRRISWRGALLVLVFSCGLCAFLLGAQVSDRELGSLTLWSSVYYTFGLFVLGGMDLGVPAGGPPVARALLWVAYFAAPAITTSALLEAALKILNNRSILRGPPRDHVVLGGCGRGGLIYLRLLRERDPHRRVLLLDSDLTRVSVAQAREHFGAEVFGGDITDPVALARLHLEHAREVFFLTGDNFANLDAAARVLEMHPELSGHMTVHLSDLRMQHLLDGGGLLEGVRRFNAHQVAAEVLVRKSLLPHFQGTHSHDRVVLAGFGRFGQTVLSELQRCAMGHFTDVVLLDVGARVEAAIFEQQVGCAEGYQRHIVEGDLRDPDSWMRVSDCVDLEHGEPVFVLGCGQDYVNLRTAIWLRGRFPEALIVVRGFEDSEFARQIAAHRRLELVSVGELLAEDLRQRLKGALEE